MKKGLSLLTTIALLFVAQHAKADGSGWNNGYYWMLWHSGGSASISLGSAGSYSMAWTNVGDVIGGKGWNPGGSRTVGYNCTAFNGGNVLGVYGWTTSPLIEYYIVEGGYAGGGTIVGTLFSDGHPYTVYKRQMFNQPCLYGTQTYWRYVSQWGGTTFGKNRSVTTGNHFNYWNSHIGSMGTFNFMVLLSEAWDGRTGYSSATVW